MRLIIYTLTGLYLLFWGEVQAASLPDSGADNYEITKKNLQAHVQFLSSDALEGRLTGTPGEKLAAQYIANIFQHLGLEPAGDKGSFFQAFDFTAGVSLGKNNALSITNQKGEINALILNQEWRPLSFSDNLAFENTTLLFAGYGITAAASGKQPSYDSYQGLDVRNKWVVVFMSMPKTISDERRRQLSQFASLRYKTFTAKVHGAKGIIFVGDAHSKRKDELIPLSFDTSLAGAGIIALSVKAKVLDSLLSNNKSPLNSLQKMQDSLDEGQLHPLPVLDGIRLVGQTDIEKKIQQGLNVLAKIRVGTDAKRMIILGAHLDHLGRGKRSGSRQRADEIDLIHPGADDNASGVASVLEVAARLSHLKAEGRLRGNSDILFAAWSGEEFGILGSSHFVKKFMEGAATNSLRPGIAAAINLDMIGHLQESLVLQGTGSSADWPKVIKSMQKKPSVSLVMQPDPYLPTDSTSFYLQGVPTLNFFTGAHDDYHTPRDKPATLNYAGIKKISGFLVDLLVALEDWPTAISYQEVQKIHHKTTRDYTIYLGTIPDYASSESAGVKISGVAKSSPAEKAGIQHDDVIIELAGKNIHDIYDYTFVLNGLHVGEPAKLMVLRGQKKVALTIVAQYRE